MLRLVSLFSGVGAFEEALGNLGVDFKLLKYCEFDPKVSRAYNVIHGTTDADNWGDITSVTEEDVSAVGECDLMTYGFPCQDISVLGLQKGFFNGSGEKTRSGLFYEAVRIAGILKPKILIAENVSNLLAKKFRGLYNSVLDELHELGYLSYTLVMNTKDYGLPHSRTRVFIVSIRDDIQHKYIREPKPVPLVKSAWDYIDKGVQDEALYYDPNSESLLPWRFEKGYSEYVGDILNCMDTKVCNKTACKQLIRDEKGTRCLNDREVLRLQGFKEEYGERLRNAGFSYSSIGYFMGNSISVPVLEALYREIFDCVDVGVKIYD